MSDVVVARDAAERRLRDHPRPEPPAIRAQVERIVASNQFAAAERLCRFLRFVVEEELAGRGRDIKEYRIGLDVFERPETYDPRLDATVRVEATKLRARLTKYYESEGRNDPVLITVPKGGYVPIIQPRITPHSANQDKPLRWPHWLWVAAAVIVALAVATIATGRLPAWFRSGILTGVPVLARLTWDPGLTSDPAITGDGHYLAYLSNREGSAHLNVWLQSTQGGAPVRLTNHPCNDFSPSFSSDGKVVAFRSECNEAGVYVAPVAGGEQKFIVRRGRNPRFAPTGRWIAYWIAGDEENLSAGKVYMVDSEHQWENYPKVEPAFGSFVHAQHPIWSSDGRMLLAMGTLQSNVPEKEYDAWVVPVKNGVAEGTPVKTGLFGVLREYGVYMNLSGRGQVVAGDWVDGFLYFSARQGHTTNLWRIALPVSRGKVTGKPERLTSGTDQEVHPRLAADGRLVFATKKVSYDLWTIPVDGNRGRAVGNPVRLTRLAGINMRPSISLDGKTVAWETLLIGQADEVQTLQVESGVQSKILQPDQPKAHPILSPDGQRVAYRVMEGIKQAIYASPARNGGPAEQICADCGAPTSWSPDGSKIFFQTGDEVPTIETVDVKAHIRQPLLRHPSYALFGARYWAGSGSRTGTGWLAFYARTGVKTRQIFIAPLKEYRAGPAPAWIAVTDGTGWDLEPCWSPDGNLLYYISDRSGSRDIWAQRLDPSTKRIIGQPFPVYRFQSASRTPLFSLNYRGAVGLSASKDRLLMSLNESEGNVWSFQVK